MNLNRRQFIQAASAATAGCVTGAFAAEPAAQPETATPTPAHLPRWRGFNLLEKFTKRRNANSPFLESDFAALAELHFDFARLPMSYLCWTDPQDWRKLREDELKDIDQAVEFGRQYGIHVNINYHRAPGYCVNPPKEPLDLWTDDQALEVCALHWGHFAKRYKGIPNNRVSFDLLNEPGDFTEAAYVRVAKALVGAIRAEDPNRLIIADGLRWGNRPVPAFAELRLAQSTRGYQPSRISHYKASWMQGSDTWPEPTWPLKISDKDVWDKERLRKEQITPWQALEKQGVGVHVGEWGAYQHTPHKVVLAWMRDYLELWKEAGWGWSMWNFRGSFGILDSNRQDITYDTWRGHKLDRAMLELIQAF
jgi:endoglucanase